MKHPKPKGKKYKNLERLSGWRETVCDRMENFKFVSVDNVR